MDSRFLCLMASVALFFTACGEPSASDATEVTINLSEEDEGAFSANSGPAETPPNAKSESKPPPTGRPRIWSEVKLHEAVRAANPGYTGNGHSTKGTCVSAN